MQGRARPRHRSSHGAPRGWHVGDRGGQPRTVCAGNLEAYLCWSATRAGEGEHAVCRAAGVDVAQHNPARGCARGDLDSLTRLTRSLGDLDTVGFVEVDLSLIH